MSEMVERVARILQDRDGSFMPGEPLDHVFVEDARAVIAAMREPTREQLEAARNPLIANGSPISKGAHEVWLAMIDEALR